MNDSILRTKSRDFAKRVITLCRKMKQSGVESALISQLLRSGTSVGANVHESKYAQGTKDFISKLEIALKECNETDYWVELLYETGSIDNNDFSTLRNDIIELRRMLVSSVTKLKAKLPPNQL